MKLLLHVGLHRSASTSFQIWLKGCQAGWAEQECLVLPGVSDAGSFSPFATLAGDLLREAGGAAGDYLAAEMDGLSPQFDRGIVSDENFLGPMPGASEPAFSTLEPLCQAIGRMARRHEIVPVVILRQHAAWLRSLYDTQRLRGEFRPFPVFAGQVAGTLSFAGLLDALAEASASRSLVYWLEDIAADDGAGLTAGIIGALGIEPGGEPQFPTSNAAQPDLVVRLAAAFGRRRAMLAEAGSPGFANEVVRLQSQGGDIENQLVALTMPRAIRFVFTLSPGQRATRAIKLYRSGVAPERMLGDVECRDAVREALRPLPPTAAILPAELTDRFKSDMAALRQHGFGPAKS